MTGVSSYSTTASENVTANTGIIWDEGMQPASVNNSARQNMADMRTQWNDASWFQYGNGSKTVAHTYASSTSTTIATDVTGYYHAGRRIKAVGSGTGTIYGKVASSSYSAPNTTVNYTWDSGSLSNEALTIYAGTAQVTGLPIPLTGIGNMGAGIAALLGAAPSGAGTKLQTANTGSGSLGSSATSGTIALPAGASLVLISEGGAIGSSAWSFIAHNQGGFVGLSAATTATSSGVTDIASVQAVSGGFTITTKAATNPVSYSYTIISGPS